jgi:hypothetical protein
MTKLLKTVGFMIAIASAGTLAGCNLYFGPDNNHPGGSGGGGGGGGSGSGYDCTMNSDCAAGCYCNNGTCEEGGFCTMDSDCGPGYHCDTGRSSCEPNPTCKTDSDCNPGEYCNSGSCTATCSCANDQEAIRQGFGWCDETRMTCMPGTDPAGDCTDAVTCASAPPSCPDGQVALVLSGCYTGQCRAITACEGAPACSHLQHEDDCLNRNQTCSAVYTGINCHKPDGSACHAGDTDCTCDSFEFHGCTDKSAGARVFQNSAGQWVDGDAYFQH